MPHEIVLVVIAVFLAPVVEAVGALTIVLAVVLAVELAVAHTTGWRDRAARGGSGRLALVLVVFALGPVLVRVSPGYSGSARRSCGRPAMQAQHDEAAIFEEEVTPGRLLAQQLQQFTLPLTTVVLPHVCHTFMRMARWSSTSTLLLHHVRGHYCVVGRPPAAGHAPGTENPGGVAYRGWPAAAIHCGRPTLLAGPTARRLPAAS